MKKQKKNSKRGNRTNDWLHYLIAILAGFMAPLIWDNIEQRKELAEYQEAYQEALSLLLTQRSILDMELESTASVRGPFLAAEEDELIHSRGLDPSLMGHPDLTRYVVFGAIASNLELEIRLFIAEDNSHRHHYQKSLEHARLLHHRYAERLDIPSLFEPAETRSFIKTHSQLVAY